MDYDDMDVNHDAYAFSGNDDSLSTKGRSKKSKKSANSDDKDEKKYMTRRKIEDMLAFKRLRDEHGWMDDFDCEFSEIY